MTDCLKISGGRKLAGSIKVSGSKNAALPVLISALLSSGKCKINNIPQLEDIGTTYRLLQFLGADCEVGENSASIQTSSIRATEAPYSLVKSLRASFWIFGPLLARVGKAQVSLPGGDAIGVRPVDLHLKGLAKLGAEIRMRHGIVYGEAPGGLRPATVDLDFPSVGATHHILMAAALIDGTTVLKGAAREPEIDNVANFLVSMGAEIEGIGTSHLVIRGRKELGDASIDIIGDRIEAATYLTAAALTSGSVSISGIKALDLKSTLEVLRNSGSTVLENGSSIEVIGSSTIQPLKLETAPYPGLATDVQPLLMSLLCRADGVSSITEKIFESRFRHVAEYRRLGADITIEGDTAHIRGNKTLSGAPVQADDIRGAAGLVLMGLVAEGETTVHEVHHLDRGYDQLIKKFSSIGAEIERLPAFEVQDVIVGC